jgi:hypothetical protein
MALYSQELKVPTRTVKFFAEVHDNAYLILVISEQPRMTTKFPTQEANITSTKT